MKDIVALIVDELSRANKVYKPFNSAHEGYAVMLEEMDELFDEIRKKRPDISRMQDEAIQVGAMAIKFIQSCCAKDINKEEVQCRMCRYNFMPTTDQEDDPCITCNKGCNWERRSSAGRIHREE